MHIPAHLFSPPCSSWAATLSAGQTCTPSSREPVSPVTAGRRTWRRASSRRSLLLSTRSVVSSLGADDAAAVMSHPLWRWRKNSCFRGRVAQISHLKGCKIRSHHTCGSRLSHLCGCVEVVGSERPSVLSLPVSLGTPGTSHLFRKDSVGFRWLILSSQLT